nr:hypothetical protein [Microvirga vignae]
MVLLDMRLPQGLAEERPGGTRIPLWRKQKVHGLPGRIDGAVEINSFAFHANACFVHTPGAVCHAPMRTDALVEFWYISLNPAKHRRIVNLDASISQRASGHRGHG